MVVALRYLNASEDICKGLQTERGVTTSMSVVTLSRFTENYTPWYMLLVWASRDSETSGEAQV